MRIKLHDGQVIITEKIVFNNIGGRAMIGYFDSGKKKPIYFCVDEVKEIVADSPANQIVGHVENQNNIF